ncbi:MAG: hypothetical protein U0531_15015 [Dehalococcoidia bacterium]
MMAAEALAEAIRLLGFVAWVGDMPTILDNPPRGLWAVVADPTRAPAISEIRRRRRRLRLVALGPAAGAAGWDAALPDPYRLADLEAALKGLPA